MNDLERELRQLDRVAAPDLTSRVERAILEPAPPARPPLGLSSARRVAVAAVAFAVFGAAGAFALRAFERTTAAASTHTSEVTDPLGSIPIGWTELPTAPATLPGAADLWTGSELLVWGGSHARSQDYTPSAEGFSFDPVARAWTSVPPAPLPGSDALAAWTGTEAIFVGVGDDPATLQGEAFDPETRTWRVLPPSPLTPRTGAVVVWTGSEVIVWGGGDRGDPSNQNGAAYDPTADSWRRIAEAPLGLNQADGFWTGTRMIVFGSLLDERNVADTRHAVGASYDPASDSWEEIAPSQLSSQASAAVWVDRRMVAFDYGWRSDAYDPATDSWTPLGDLAFTSGECYPDGAVLAGKVFAFGCGEAASLSPGDRTWVPIDNGMTDATVDGYDRPLQLWRFATLVPAGDVLFLDAQGLTVSASHIPCYGCPGSPTSFWAYRPGAASG